MSKKPLVRALRDDCIESLLEDIGNADANGLKDVIQKINNSGQYIQKTKDKITKANLAFVISLSLKMSKSEFHSEFEEMVQWGNIGLMKGINRFDPKKNYGLRTYCAWWIRHEIKLEAIKAYGLIKLPAYMEEKRAKLKRRAAKKLREEGEIIDEEEEAHRMGFSELVTTTLTQTSRNRIALYINGHQTKNGEAEFLETIYGSVEDPSEKVISEVSSKKLIEKFMNMLEPKEQGVLTMRFGLDGRKECALEDTAGSIGLSRERIRRIEKRAFNKIRAHSRFTGLEL